MAAMTFSEFEDYINSVEDKICKAIEPIVLGIEVPWHIQLSSIYIDLIDKSESGDSGRSYMLPSKPEISMSFERTLR